MFRVGLTTDITTANWWAAMGSSSSPADRALLGDTKVSLFALSQPGFHLVPALAATPEPISVTRQGSVWAVDQPMRDDVRWSDGEPVTAGDLVFYFDVVREFDLGGAHAAHFPPNVVDVSAVDDFTVRVEFSDEPSLTDWQTGVAMAPLAPSHFWEPHVEAARNGTGPGREHLYSIESPREPSSGSQVFEWRDDAVAVTRSNPDYFARGTEPTVYPDVGPWVSGVEWHQFENEAEAYAALSAEEVDFVYQPGGMSLPRYNDLATNGETRLSISQADGFRFLAFNLRKPPMSDPVFRRAVATIIDKELIASSLYNGTLFPAYTVVHPDLESSYNPDVVRPGWSDGEPMTEADRFQTAIAMLGEAGYTWEIEPDIVYDADGGFTELVGGSGLEMPNGVDVPELTILAAPESGDDPMRATVALWIEQWMTDLGMTVTTETAAFGSVVETAVEPASLEDTLAWDLHVLGWGAPNLALPGTTLPALFHSQNGVETGGLNTTGYASAEFDSAADAFVASQTIGEAAEWTREMERIIAEDLPYVTLYRDAVIEGFGSRVEFPVDAIMGGHAAAAGAWPGSVRKRGSS